MEMSGVSSFCLRDLENFPKLVADHFQPFGFNITPLKSHKLSCGSFGSFI